MPIGEKVKAGGLIMGRTYAQIRDLIEIKLADTANATFSTGTIDEYMTWGLREIARYVPY